MEAQILDAGRLADPSPRLVDVHQVLADDVADEDVRVPLDLLEIGQERQRWRVCKRRLR